jgi:hypothetical protein
VKGAIVLAALLVVCATASGAAPRFGARSEVVDNRWFPLEPATRLLYTGTSSDGAKRLEFVVTDLVKVVGGVRNIVVWYREYTDGELVEEELDYFAQDTAGNVWHLGEYPEEYEDGKFRDAPGWLDGAQGAHGGIALQAHPRSGTPSYVDGYAPAVDVDDRARVLRAGQRNCVPHGCYRDVVVTSEFSPGEPGMSQLKYYAPGVGNIRVGWAGRKDTDHEVMALVSVTHLGPQPLARARAAAVRMDQRSYKRKPGVFGRTRPAVRLASPGP